MKKVVAVIVLFACVSTMLFSDYTPYERTEFPSWSLKLRRFETLTFGALPITLGITTLAYSTALTLGSSHFYDDPLKDSFAVLGVAVGSALVVALADYIIGEMQKR
ncbi:MAG: hypothetical protein ACOX0W_06360 [Sphaerochaetaceae bacterium]|jgi:hypothetical protein